MSTANEQRIFVIHLNTVIIQLMNMGAKIQISFANEEGIFGVKLVYCHLPVHEHGCACADFCFWCIRASVP